MHHQYNLIMNNTVKKNKYFIFAIIAYVTLLLLSCNHYTNSSNINQSRDEEIRFDSHDEFKNRINDNKKLDIYKYYDVFDLSPIEIIIPKNQTNSQSLSVVVDDNCGHLIVFDGGRVEDADYLCDIIKDNGGIVTTWFITHIHDDHIGALYKILSDKRTDISINKIVYNFADFEWYYSKMGNDAGIYYLFEDAIKNYNEHLSSISKDEIYIINHDNIDTHRFFFFSLIKDNSPKLYCGNGPKPDSNKVWYNSMHLIDVTPLNDVYTLDQDPINNTSIVYQVSLLDYKYNMLIFGDLGYEGGNKLFEYIDSADNKYFAKKVYSSDIVVLAHHGQNGIDPEIYKKFKPTVVVWPTSKDVYENANEKYYTDDTKKALSEINSIKYQIKSYEETAVIR